MIDKVKKQIHRLSNPVSAHNALLTAFATILFKLFSPAVILQCPNSHWVFCNRHSFFLAYLIYPLL
jgi:hypothetical protein